MDDRRATELRQRSHASDFKRAARDEASAQGDARRVNSTSGNPLATGYSPDSRNVAEFSNDRGLPYVNSFNLTFDCPNLKIYLAPSKHGL
jgi:hypothetical protein